MNKQAVLIIEDEPQIRKLLKINLESNDYKVIEASSGKEGLLLAASHLPDIVLLDLGLPDIHGHQVLTELRQWFTKAIVVLSVLNGEDDIVTALDNGATDYLSKPFRVGELLARIRSASRRDTNDMETSILKSNEIEVDLVARIVKKKGEMIKLTLTEYNLFVLLIRNEGRVLTHKHILKEIWGVGSQTETQYLRVFIAQIRKKIETNSNNPEHIITVSGIGYRYQ